MFYEILQTKITYSSGKITEVIVLWKDNEYTRATISTLQNKSGYHRLQSNQKLSEELLQQVAGYGSSLDEKTKNKIFNIK